VTRKGYLLGPHSESQELCITYNYCCTNFLEPLRKKKWYFLVGTVPYQRWGKTTQVISGRIFWIYASDNFLLKNSHFLLRAGLIIRKIVDLCHLSREKRDI